MLKLKYLFENFELAKFCLRSYAHNEEHACDYFGHFRISSNAIYPFPADDSGRVCFLRLSPAEEKSIRDVESEIRFISWLAGRGFPAMKPYPMKDGSLCNVTETQWGTYNVSCFERIPGKTLEDADGDSRLAFGYGKTLGLLHNQSQEYPRSTERMEHEEFLGMIYNCYRQYDAPQLMMTALADVTQKLKTLPVSSDVYGLVHYDFEPDNVLYDSKTDKFGVIDFDDSIRCWYALDVARAIDAMGDVTSDEAAIPAFIEGYRTVRSLSDQQLQSLPLMREIVMLQSYSTALYVLSEIPDEMPDWLKFIIERQQTLLKDTEAHYANKY